MSSDLHVKAHLGDIEQIFFILTQNAIEAAGGKAQEVGRAHDGQEQVAIVTVDPRNQLYLAMKLWRDVCRYRPGLWTGMRTALQVFSLPAIIVNGRVLTKRGRPLEPDIVCHAVREQLEWGETHH